MAYAKSIKRTHLFFFVSFILIFCNLIQAQSTSIAGIVNTYSAVSEIYNCNVEVTDPSSFSAGNRVLIIQMKGAIIDSSNSSTFGDVLNLKSCGNYEFCYISTISGNTINFTAPLQRTYEASGSVQLIKVPEYTNATISSPLSCLAWNGSIGGVMVIECSGTLTFNDNIDVKSKGFRGGNVSPTGFNCPGHFDYYYSSTDYFGAVKGEGIAEISSSKSNGMGKLANGGGGGNNVNAGGGGGSNFGSGGKGGNSWEGCPLMDIGGRGGQALLFSNTLNKIYLGGGGGGGQQNNLQATAGTGGGGIVIIRADNIVGNNKTIFANATNAAAGGCDGAGGGGGGGGVLLDVNSFSSSLNIYVNGGEGAITTCYAQGASGGGGGGYIWSKNTLPSSVVFTANGGARGMHGNGSEDGIPGDTLSGLIVHSAQKPGISGPFSVCSNVSLSFSQSTSYPPDSVFWNFDDTNFSSSLNPSHVYIDTGFYNVSSITYYPLGCKDTNYHQLHVTGAFANFNTSPVCLGQTTSFNDLSTASVGNNITNWTWSTGDGGNSGLQNFMHTYSSCNTYNVKLIVTSDNGCIDSLTKADTVYCLPLVDAGIDDTICKGSSTTLQATPNNFVSYNWQPTFSLNNSNTYNPIANPTAETIYTVYVIDNNGCSSNDSIKISLSKPTAAFSVNDTCMLTNLTFIDNSTSDYGTILSWQWNFDDGDSTSGIYNPNHIYTLPGNFNVRLIVSNSLGCKDTVENVVQLFEKPIAAYTTNDVCFGSLNTFNDLSTISSGNIVAWTWNFNDNNSASQQQNSSYTYSNAGDFYPELIVISDHTCIDTITDTVHIHPIPTVQFSKTNVCQGQTASFSNTSIIPSNTTNDSLNSSLWSFGDNTSGTGSSVAHNYNIAGSFTVTLTTSSSFGCIDSISNNIIINPKPVPQFTVSDTIGCSPVCISFQNTSFVSGGNVTEALWNFGDGSSNNSFQDIIHCYSNDSALSEKLYNPSLIVTSDSGCTDTLIKNNLIKVLTNPSSQFTVYPTSTNYTSPEIYINNSSINANQWNWDFGDGQNSNDANPIQHIFADTGSFSITLIVNSSNGCSDTTSKLIYIEPEISLFIPNSFSPNDDGINDFFFPKGAFIKEFEMLIFDRWGNLVFKTDSIDKPWDGKFSASGQMVQADVYVYSIKITDYKTLKHNYRGTVTTIK